MNYARIDYHPHAQARMAARRIAPRQVARVLAAADRAYPGNQPGRLVAERDTAAGNTLRVVDVERDGGATAYVLTVIRIGGTA